VAQHGGGTLSGGLICAFLRSCRALVLWTNTSQNHVLLTTAWFVITTIPLLSILLPMVSRSIRLYFGSVPVLLGRPQYQGKIFFI